MAALGSDRAGLGVDQPSHGRSRTVLLEPVLGKRLGRQSDRGWGAPQSAGTPAAAGKAMGHVRLLRLPSVRPRRTRDRHLDDARGQLVRHASVPIRHGLLLPGLRPFLLCPAGRQRGDGHSHHRLAGSNCLELVSAKGGRGHRRARRGFARRAARVPRHDANRELVRPGDRAHALGRIVVLAVAFGAARRGPGPRRGDRVQPSFSGNLLLRRPLSRTVVRVRGRSGFEGSPYPPGRGRRGALAIALEPEELLRRRTLHAIERPGHGRPALQSPPGRVLRPPVRPGALVDHLRSVRATVPGQVRAFQDHATGIHPQPESRSRASCTGGVLAQSGLLWTSAPGYPGPCRSA